MLPTLDFELSIAHLDSPPSCNWVDGDDNMCDRPAAWTCSCVLCGTHTGLLCNICHEGAMGSPAIYFHYACVAEGTFAEITLTYPSLLN